MPVTMLSGWGWVPWPMFVMMPVMLALVGLAAWRAERSPLGSCGAARGRPTAGRMPAATPDPLVTLRERFARGDLDIAEFEERVVGLLRSEPGPFSSWPKDPEPLAGNGDRP